MYKKIYFIPAVPFAVKVLCLAQGQKHDLLQM
jgi:hypothetical protein